MENMSGVCVFVFVPVFLAFQPSERGRQHYAYKRRTCHAVQTVLEPRGFWVDLHYLKKTKAKKQQKKNKSTHCLTLSDISGGQSYNTLPLYLCEFCSAASVNELAAELDGLHGIRLQLLLDPHFLSDNTCKNRRKGRHKCHLQSSYI